MLQIAIHDMQIGAANRAGRDLDKNLIGTGGGPRHLCQPQGPTGCVEHHCAHKFRHGFLRFRAPGFRARGKPSG
jgi:hypothetical protein